MTRTITVNKFRELLDELSLTHKKVGDHTFRMPIPMDDDFEETLGISFEVREQKIQAWAAIPGFGVENPRSDSLEFCNLWNRKKVSPKVYVDKDGDFIAEQTIYIDEEVSDEFIKENFIMFSIVTMREFFSTLSKRLNNGASSLEENDENLTPREKFERLNEIVEQLRSLVEGPGDDEEDEEKTQRRKTTLDFVTRFLEERLGFTDDEEDEDEDDDEDDERFRFFDPEDAEDFPFHFPFLLRRNGFSNDDEEEKTEVEEPSEEALRALEQLVAELIDEGKKGKGKDGKNERK